MRRRPAPRSDAVADTGATTPEESSPSAAALAETLDPEVDVWLKDHCPTWNRPALPMMVVVDRLAAAAAATGPADARVVAVRDVRLAGWIDFAAARSLTAESVMRGDGQMMVRLLDGTDGSELATARVELGTFDEPPQALPHPPQPPHDDATHCSSQ